MASVAGGARPPGSATMPTTRRRSKGGTTERSSNVAPPWSRGVNTRSSSSGERRLTSIVLPTSRSKASAVRKAATTSWGSAGSAGRPARYLNGETSRPIRPDASAMKLTDGVSMSTPSSDWPAAASTDSVWVWATPGSAATSSKSTEAKSKVPGMPLTTRVWWAAGVSTKRSTAESERRAPATRARANPAERPMMTATPSQAPARRRRSAWNRYRRNDPPPPRISPSVAQRRRGWRGGGPSSAGVATPPPEKRP